MSYQQEYQRSIDNPEAFWREKASVLPWFKQPSTILATDDNGIARWFVDGELNTCFMALDAHIEQGRGEQAALIYDSPVTGSRRQYSYNELRDEVAVFAGALARLGVGKGDRVLVYMPMVPEAAIAMLACARLGAVHSVVFGGFAPNELKTRIDDAEPRVVVTASCGIEVDRVIPYKPMLDAAIDLARHKPAHCVVLQRQQAQAELLAGRDLDWQQATDGAEAADCVPVLATDPLYILYTSGTTGAPKGIVRDNGGHAVALNYSMQAIYNINPGEVFWAASDVGWVVGHSYIVYGPLLAGCTTLFYEGKPVKTPDAGAFWRVISEYGVKAIFSAPTAFRAIKKEDPEGKLLAQYDMSCLQTLFLAGERLDPPTYEWLQDLFARPVIDHWWQTETGWAIAANLTGIELVPTRPGSATYPVPGYDIRILDDEGNELPRGEQGAIAVKLPLPPACLPTIWRDHERFVSGYLDQFPGYYVSGDGGYFDQDGYLFVMGRTDDVINVAGHRLSTGELEEVVGGHPAVAECAVIGVQDALRGQIPVALICLKDGIATANDVIEAEVVQRVRDTTGAVACLRQALVVKRLPKTRSGKILRAILHKIADGEAYKAPSTIDDPAVLEDLTELMRRRAVGSFAGD
jgi:propionyl-CoA synthetase